MYPVCTREVTNQRLHGPLAFWLCAPGGADNGANQPRSPKKKNPLLPHAGFQVKADFGEADFGEQNLDGLLDFLPLEVRVT